MSKFTISINNEARLTIIQDPKLRDKTILLLNSMSEQFLSRYKEIVDYLNQTNADEFSYENIHQNFSVYFTIELLEKAIVIAITGKKQYDIKENMLSLLTEENLSKAIMGETMIKAFKDAIVSTPVEDAYEHAHRGALIYNLETMDDEEYFDGNSKQKCTVKRDDERAKEFYEGWPNVLSPQWKDGKFLGCKKYVEGEELKGISEYLKDDIDD